VRALDKPKASGKKKDTFIIDALAMLAAMAVLAWYYYGERALRLILFSALTALLMDWFGNSLLNNKQAADPLYALFTGAAIALLLPASSPYWLPVIGSSFAIIAAKLPFGGKDNLPFVPIAAGIAFLCISFPQMVFSYPAVEQGAEVAVYGSPSFAPSASIAEMLSKNNSIGVNVFGYLNILTGAIPSPMGTGSLLLMSGIALYMYLRNPKMFISGAGFIATCAIFAVLFPRVITGRRISLLMELSSGMLLFAAIFLVPQKTLRLKNPTHRLLYGMATGAVCMLLRYFGAYEEGVCFAVMLMNGVIAAMTSPRPVKSRKSPVLTEEKQTEDAVSSERSVAYE